MIERAIDILGAGNAKDEDRDQAWEEIEDEAVRQAPDRLMALLPTLGGTDARIRLAAKLAAWLERAGRSGEAARLISDALAAIRDTGSADALVLLARKYPAAGRLADERTRAVLREILKGLAGCSASSTGDSAASTSRHAVSDMSLGRALPGTRP